MGAGETLADESGPVFQCDVKPVSPVPVRWRVEEPPPGDPTTCQGIHPVSVLNKALEMASWVRSAGKNQK